MIIIYQPRWKTGKKKKIKKMIEHELQELEKAERVARWKYRVALFLLMFILATFTGLAIYGVDKTQEPTSAIDTDVL